MNPFQYLKVLDHHAYFIHSFKNGIIKLKEYLKDKFNIDHRENPDFFHEKFETLGIDESRKIKEIHSSKSFIEGKKRIFIIECSNITNEAQNSLLKIFEEPHTDSHFFLIMPSSEILLPTLRSRLLIIKKETENDFDKEEYKEIIDFIKMPKKDKITFVDNIAKMISDEKESKSFALEFLSKLEMYLYKNNKLENVNALQAILKAREYMNDRSPSIKQLLEYVALNI